MSRYSDHDAYLDSESGVLKNRLHIKDAATLEKAEADLAAARSRELSIKPVDGNFDLKHFQAIHRYLFGDLYEWAGELRTVDITKDGSTFAHHAYLRGSADSIFKHLARESHLKGLDSGQFSARAAYYLGELNALHPFREGNGRAQREFMSHVAHANKMYLAWENLKQPEMVQASIDSFHGETSKLAGLIHGILYRL